jgi:hypothetical protein
LGLLRYCSSHLWNAQNSTVCSTGISLSKMRIAKDRLPIIAWTALLYQRIYVIILLGGLPAFAASSITVRNGLVWGEQYELGVEAPRICVAVHLSLIRVDGRDLDVGGHGKKEYLFKETSRVRGWLGWLSGMSRHFCARQSIR